MAHGRLVIGLVAILGLMLTVLPLGVTGDTTTTLTIDAPAEVAPGGEFIARVAVDHVQDFGGTNFDITYDPTVITVTDVTDGEIGEHTIPVGSGNWAYQPPGTEDTGKIRVLAFMPGARSPGVTGTGYLAEIHFRVVGPAVSGTDIVLDYARLYDYVPEEIPITRVHGAVTVAGPPAELQISTTSPLPHASLGEAYSATLAASGGTSPYTWTASGLPNGLTCSTGGVISGTPTQSGDFTVTVTVTDEAAASQSKELNLRVEETVADLAITTTDLPDGELGHAYSATLAATGGTSPYTWSASGLPNGLTCSTGGVISGTPTQSGDFTVTVTVTDEAAASQSKELALEIHPTPTEPTISISPRSFSFSAVEGGANPDGRTLEIWNSGPGTLDWSVSTNAQWLSLSPSSGISTGERNSVTVSVDIAGVSAGDHSATITIAAPGAANTPRSVTVGLEISADPDPPVNDDDQPTGRPPLFVLWIALGAIAIAVVTVLVLKRHPA